MALKRAEVVEEAVRRPSSAILPVTSEVGQLRSGVALRRRRPFFHPRILDPPPRWQLRKVPL